MVYILLLAVLKPFLYLIGFFRQKCSGSLIIQSAKIGDYVNTTVMFEALGVCDVAIESVNAALAKNDTRIEKIWLIDAYKRTLAGRLALGFGIFWRNYKNIYVVTPNNLNLFLGLMGQTRLSTLRHYKSGKTAKILLKFYDNVLLFTKSDLTLDVYLGMIDVRLNHSNVKKKTIAYKNIPSLPSPFDSQLKKIGVALSAGNKIKELGLKEWKKIFAI